MIMEKYVRVCTRQLQVSPVYNSRVGCGISIGILRRILPSALQERGGLYSLQGLVASDGVPGWIFPDALQERVGLYSL